MLSEYYKDKLRSLNVDRSSGHPKPHKVCLLLSVLELIESGLIKDNRIMDCRELRTAFHHHFERFKKANDTENMNLPFYHLQGDGFWHFQVKQDKRVDFEELVANTATPSMKRLFEVVDYAYLDPELFDYFSNSLVRLEIREVLLENLEDLSVQFHRWLISMGKSDRTASSYVGAIRGTVSDWATEANITGRNLISISGYSTINMVMEGLLRYEAFQEQDRRGNNMYSAALNSYKKFLSITCQVDVSEDIETIIKDKDIGETEKARLVNARVGQGKYREELLSYWKFCALTGYASTQFLVASHIKPWRKSNNEERLDKYNGLLLLANLDKAFDLGYITFLSSGKIVVSESIERPELLGVENDMHVKLERQHQGYMEFHRGNVFERF